MVQIKSITHTILEQTSSPPIPYSVSKMEEVEAMKGQHANLTT